MDQLGVDISGGSVERADLAETAKRSVITCRLSAADNRCRRTRQCGEMPLRRQEVGYAWL